MIFTLNVFKSNAVLEQRLYRPYGDFETSQFITIVHHSIQQQAQYLRISFLFTWFLCTSLIPQGTTTPDHFKPQVRPDEGVNLHHVWLTVPKLS